MNSSSLFHPNAMFGIYICFSLDLYPSSDGIKPTRSKTSCALENATNYNLVKSSNALSLGSLVFFPRGLRFLILSSTTEN